MSRPSTEPAPAPPAADPSQLPDQFTVAAVDMSHDLHGHARDEALQRYTEEMNQEGGFARRFARNVWKGNIFREYYIQQHTTTAMEDMAREGTYYLHATDEDRQAAIDAIMDRFTSQYEETIHRDAGEDRWQLEEHDPAAASVIHGVRDVVGRYARGELNDEELAHERDVLFAQVAENPDTAELLPETGRYADNLEYVARNVKAAVDHGADLNEALQRVRVVAGEARTGVRTEAQYTRVDRIIDRINSSRIGSLVARPSAVASVASIVASVAGWGSQRAVTAAGMTLAPGVAGAGMAAVKEGKRIKDERRQHGREMAQGGQFDADARRREGMEETRYDTATARDITEALGVALGADEAPRADLTADEASGLLGSLSEAVARKRLSNREDRDYISYSAVERVETERFELDVRIAEAMVALESSLENTSDDSLRTALGIEADESYEVALEREVADVVTMLHQDVEAKDTAFSSLRRREMAKAAGKGAAMGTGIGLVFQEGLALVSDSRTGLVESMASSSADKPGQHETLLKGLFGDNTHLQPGGESTGQHLLSLGDHADAQLPDNLDVQPSGEHGFDVVDADGHKIADLHTNADGSLTQESLDTLSDHGISVEDHPETVAVEVPATRQGTAAEYLQANNAQNVNRGMWYDNNTPRFDQNELRTHWGSVEGGPGMDAQGNIHMTTGQMTPEGSFHNDMSVEWQSEAANGRLQLFVSASRETQDQGFFIPIDGNGNVVIPAGHPAAQLFSMGPDGQPIFHGGFVEVSQMTGTDGAGTHGINVLSTLEGTNDTPTFTIPGTEIVEQTTHHYTFEAPPATPLFGVERDFTEMAPWIPAYSRKALEDLLDREIIGSPYYYANRIIDEAEVKARSGRFSPRLRDNPEAKLDDATEIDWYMEQHNTEYRDKLRRHADEMGEMHANTDIVVAIPVAGHQEADNIYRTLEAYLDQTIARDRFEIVLYVNNPETNEAGVPLNSDATLTEIDRFKNDHPDLAVRVFHENVPRSEASIGRYRKTLVDTVLMRHRDRIERAGDKQLVIVSNDADTVRINEQYLDTMYSKLDEDPRLEALVGQIDWDNKAYVNYPEVHVGTRLFQFFDMMLRHKEGLIGATSGANTAFKASTYAAVGGYDADYDIVEDVRLGRDFRVARYRAGIDPIAFAGVRASRIETSARRSVWTWLNHRDSPYNQWNHGFSADDDAVRSINVDTLTPYDFADTGSRAQLLQNIEKVINATLRSLGPDLSVPSEPSTGVGAVSPAAAEYISRSLGFLGVEFEWAGSYRAIRITNGDRLLDGLAEYADRVERRENAT